MAEEKASLRDQLILATVQTFIFGAFLAYSVCGSRGALRDTRVG